MMYCDRCGTRLEASQRFCPGCGKALAGAGPVLVAAPQGRVASHVRLLGILWLASSVLHFIPGFFLLIFFRHGFILPPEVPPFINPMMQFIGLVLLGVSVLGLMAGWGLLERQPWARTLSIALGVVHLINVPFGTALGAYTLWVLLPSDSEMEYSQIARAA